MISIRSELRAQVHHYMSNMLDDALATAFNTGLHPGDVRFSLPDGCTENIEALLMGDWQRIRFVFVADYRNCRQMTAQERADLLADLVKTGRYCEGRDGILVRT